MVIAQKNRSLQNMRILANLACMYGLGIRSMVWVKLQNELVAKNKRIRWITKGIKVAGFTVERTRLQKLFG